MSRTHGAHPGPCIYCEHGPYCVECPPPAVTDGPVCDSCRARIVSAGIAADPYYRGDYVAMFGDDE